MSGRGIVSKGPSYWVRVDGARGHMLDGAIHPSSLKDALAYWQTQICAHLEDDTATTYYIGPLAVREDPDAANVEGLCRDLLAKSERLATLEAHANALRDALERIAKAHEDAAYDSEAQRVAVFNATAGWAREALAQTPAASLAAHNAEMLERAAKLVDVASHEPGAQGYSGGPKYVDMVKLAKAIRALAAQEVKP